MLGALTMEGLIDLLHQYERAHDEGAPTDSLIATITRETQFPHVSDWLRIQLIHNLVGAQHVAERFANYQPVKPKLSREEMIELVAHITDGSEAQVEEKVDLFSANCKHPSGSDLIFWPDLVSEFGEGREPTVEEIVDLAMRDPKS